MHNIDDIPIPSSHSLARSNALSSYITQEIDRQADHILSFADFMSQALYHPKLGYYMQPDFKIGKFGDFTTAPQLTPLFAACLAQQCQEIFQALGSYDLLELGAGTGQFAADLLTALGRHHSTPSHYYIYEISPALRLKQKQFFEQHHPQLLPQVIWLEQLPTQFAGIIIANEVLDALPVHRFTIHEAKAYEHGVSASQNQFAWERKQLHPQLLEQAQRYQQHYHLPDGYTSELHIILRSFVTEISNSLNKGMIFFIDYGYGEAEYYHQERHAGSLTCFYQHRHHQNPLIYPGLQDITAHVNFTEVIDAAHDAGCALSGFTTQSAFLLASGLLNHAETLISQASPAEAFNIHQSIKTLTLPTQMGDRIKVMALSKNMDLSPKGFQLADRRRDL